MGQPCDRVLIPFRKSGREFLNLFKGEQNEHKVLIPFRKSGREFLVGPSYLETTYNVLIPFRKSGREFHKLGSERDLDRCLNPLQEVGEGIP